MPRLIFRVPRDGKTLVSMTAFTVVRPLVTAVLDQARRPSCFPFLAVHGLGSGGDVVDSIPVSEVRSRECNNRGWGLKAFRVQPTTVAAVRVHLGVSSSPMRLTLEVVLHERMRRPLIVSPVPPPKPANSGSSWSEPRRGFSQRQGVFEAS